MNNSGIIFNIQKFSVHDGPGIRTVVFLKGCPLHCKWCANPESQRFETELGWTAKDCIGCLGCEKEIRCADCKMTEDGVQWTEKEALSSKEITKACPTGALHVIGERRTSSEIIDIVKKDYVFYKGGGGLTLGGGEPLSQPDFAIDILEKAREENIHCAIETSSFAGWNTVDKAARLLDYYLTDIKTMNDDIHIKYTGVSNKIIIDNIRHLLQEYPSLPVRIRTPIIPGVNDTEDDIKSIGTFLNEFDERQNLEWELLKYHRLGVPKYNSLHRNYDMGEVQLSEQRFEELKNFAKKINKNAVC